MKTFKLFKKKNEGTVKDKKEKKLWKTILSILLSLAIVGVSLILIFALYIVITSPDFEKKELYQSEPSILYDKNGKEFARVGDEDSTLITYDELPNVLIDALVATEDSRFFQHNGLDLFRFLKTIFKTLLGSSDAGGASTLSMQVIKNTYTQKGQLEHNKIKSLVRKFRDIYMAVFKLEANYTKEEIIEFYLNSQWFANSASINTSGITGVERASQYYFGKSVKDINLAEASLMAGMFQNPYRYNLYKNPEGCRKRQTTVLKLLVKHGYITQEQADAVLEIPISSMVIEKPTTSMKVESYQAFVDYVINEVNEDLGLNPRRSSLKIYTTFDPSVQSVLQKVEEGDVFDFPNEVIQEGIAVTSTADGSIAGLSGGRNYQAMGLNRASDLNAQPGSTAKPLFDYAMYIEHISQSTYAMFLDEETTYSNGARISDYDNKHRGLLDMRECLRDSRNIPALLAFQAVYKENPDLIKDFIHSVGIDYGSELYESAAIGGFNGTNPLELSSAYASFGRGGYYIKPYAYTKVINNSTGEEINNSYAKNQVMESSTAFMINNLLMTAYGGQKPSGTSVAGKTGTTNLDSNTKKVNHLPGGAIKEVWFVTYSPSYSIALWYGYDQIYKDASEKEYFLTSAKGGAARKKIMNYLSSKIHKKDQSFSGSKAVVQKSVELETFPPQLCSEFTPKVKGNNLCISEYFVRGTEPTEVSNRFSKLDAPTNGNYTYSGNTITLTWDPIKTPDAINKDYLISHFNEYYGKYANKYYEKRLDYNKKYIGTLGYDVYLKTASDNETYVGYTNNSSFVYNVSSGGEYNFIIRSSYSIFKDNRSNGLTITTKTIDPNISDIVDTPTTTPTEQSTSAENNTN